LFAAGAVSTAFFSLLLVLPRLGQPKKRHFLGVLVFAAFLSVLNAPMAVLLAEPKVMHTSDFVQLLGLTLFGSVVFSPLSGALGASFGLAWLAALTRFSQATEKPALTDPSSLALRLGAGALSLAFIVALAIGVMVDAPLLRERALYRGGAVPGSEMLMVAGLAFMVAAGLVLGAYGLWSRRGRGRLMRTARGNVGREFCVAPSGHEPAAIELLALTRDRACERILCRRLEAKGDGAYRLNRDHLTPWVRLT